MSQQQIGKRREDDAFLTSMTFAAPGQFGRGCDCDECGDAIIPADIQSAIQQHKRQKLLETPLIRTQDRALIKREESVSVWKWTLPLEAEPLIEFGNNHRMVFVKQLDKESTIMSIGKGILGSSDETKGRSKVHWKEGRCYFVPSNGGKALGWIHTKDRISKDQLSKHTLLYHIKVPLSEEKVIEAAADEDNASDCKWVNEIFKLFANEVSSQRMAAKETSVDIDQSNTNDASTLSEIEMSNDVSEQVAQIIKSLEQL